MNINNFFKTLEYLQEEFIPKNNYPKNAIFSNTYKDLDYVLSNNLLKSCNDKYLVFYKENCGFCAKKVRSFQIAFLPKIRPQKKMNSQIFVT